MKTAIIIVNYNNWEDTFRAIKSCLGIQGFDGSVFICDNKSTNDSFNQLKKCLSGQIDVPNDADFSDVSLLYSPNSYTSFFGSYEEVKDDILNNNNKYKRIYLIESDKNGGFSYGNNLCIKLALLDKENQLFWMLNSDAVATKSSILNIEKTLLNIKKPILAGTVILEYWKPKIIQSLGAKKHVSYFGFYLKNKSMLSYMNGLSREVLSTFSADIINAAYPIGASMIVNRSYLESFGILEEQLFLYHEELDLSHRLPINTTLILLNAIVYHKGGASIEQGKNEKIISKKTASFFNQSYWIVSKKLGGVYVFIAIAFLFLRLIKRFSINYLFKKRKNNVSV